MGAFDNAKIVKINNKEVESIKTTNGATIYQKPTAIIVVGNLSLGINRQWLNTTGNVTINWGDGSANTVNNPTTTLKHTYTDGKQSHDILFIGKITGFGEFCFYNCTGLTSITIPSTITSLGEYCFSDCTSLTSITIPNSVTSLGEYCLRGCTGLNTYQLYWTNNNIITYESQKHSNNRL